MLNLKPEGHTEKRTRDRFYTNFTFIYARAFQGVDGINHWHGTLKKCVLCPEYRGGGGLLPMQGRRGGGGGNCIHFFTLC